LKSLLACGDGHEGGWRLRDDSTAVDLEVFFELPESRYNRSVEESIADANLDATDQRRVGGCVEHGLFAKNLMKPGGEGRLLVLFEFDSCPDIYFNATPGILDELVKCCVDHLEVSKSSIGVEDQKESHEQVGDSISED
jgi:hypothetical protein